MWKSLFICCVGLLLARYPAIAQSAPATPTPDSLVRRILSRAITMQGFRALAPPQRRALAAWAAAAGARFAGRVGGFWYTPEDARRQQAFYDTLRYTVSEWHQAKPTLVVQGTVFEIIYPQANKLPIPNKIRAEFGEDTVAVPQRNFDFASMMYPAYFAATNENHYRWDDRPPGEAPGTPDMSQPETQLWFYCHARRQLDAGCEAIHFGQVMLMDDRDAGHHAWWSMLQRVRAYARTRNRGFVLCDAHTHGEYYDPDPDHPLPPARRQLLFDFHACPSRPVEIDTIRRGTHSARLDYGDPNSRTGAIYGLSSGGLAPNGQYYKHLPALAELDNGTTATPGIPGQQALAAVWGLDEISWFATQPSDYRTQWLVYAQVRIHQLDPNVYFEMPGLRGVTYPPHPDRFYRADVEGQGDIIRAIWASPLKQLIRQNRRNKLISP